MSTSPRPMRDLLVALFGPIVWAAHFFALYLIQAFTCTAVGPSHVTQVRLLGGGLTLVAIAALLAFAAWHSRDFRLVESPAPADPRPQLWFAGPLTLVSALAVAWTAFPLFLLPACTAGNS
jgi:hypothetical protein